MGDDAASYSETNELAKERNRAAATRTLLAWIRTSLSLIGFGFGIDRIVNVLASGKHSQSGLTEAVALAFMALGIFALVSAAIDYRSEQRQLSQVRYTYESRRSFAMIVAVLLAAVGAAAFIGVLVQSFLAERI